jgi:hypothetical protein
VGSQVCVIRQERAIMKVTNRGRGNTKLEREASSGVLADGGRWEIIPRWHVTQSILADYLSIVSKAADAAINKQAVNPTEDAARALAAGFGAAMVSHGRQLNNEGYEQGDFECKAFLGLFGEDGNETTQYHEMRAETESRHRAEREAERMPR